MRIRLLSALLLAAMVSCVLAARPAAATSEASKSVPRGMFALYEENRKNGIPNYITEDFLVLSYSMLVDQALGEVEERRLGPAFARLIERLRAGLVTRADGEARRANERFLAVVAALLEGVDPAAVGDPGVAGELRRVLLGAGIGRSELALQRLDYSQFQIRGRYADRPELERYFRAVRYAGSVLFPVVASRATGITPQAADRLTHQAIQLTSLISGDPATAAAWHDFTGELEWWFGPADDLGVDDYRAVAHGNAELDLATLRHLLLERARANGRQPRILGSPVDLDRLEEGRTAGDVLTGWRLFPQRFTADGAAFQQLVYGEVGRYLGDGRPHTLTIAGGEGVKGFPSAYELMALLGSTRAEQVLDATDERNYEGYAEAAKRARRQLAEAGGLAGEHFELLRHWLEGDPGSPRRVATALGFWTWHRYTNLLYAKPSYSGVSKGFRLPPKRRHAWLEPAAELYARLAQSARRLEEKASCGTCGIFSDLLERCVQIAVRERAGLELESDAVAFLNDLDFELFQLTGERDKPIVVDVHTDASSGQVMQEGLGWPEVVERPLDGGQVSRGALFRHYELKQPLLERLNDTSWARRLAAGELPE